MGENLRPNIPDPDATQGCRVELTQTNSDSSAITVDAVASTQPSSPHSQIPPPKGQLTEWTDEKHSSYLGSLEASFVTELHRSMQLRGLRSQDNMWRASSSEKPQAKTRNSSDQFFVLRDGCWQKINFERNDAFSNSTADSHVVLGTPWIRRFTSSSKQRTVRSPDARGHGIVCNKAVLLKENFTSSRGSLRGLEQHSVCLPCHQDLVGNITEVSDQNFEDEDQGEMSSRASMVKRLKTASVDATNNDQVVPLGKFCMTDVATVSNASSEREQEGTYELLSEHPESFVCPKSDLHYCLKGS